MIFLCLIIPFILQGGAFFLDEFVYHRRRGLPLWERIGHPIDTASVIVPLIYVWRTSFSADHLLVFAGMALGSCLLVTKDEFVHAELCEPREQWLHGLLFVLHPLLFVTVAVLWYLEFLGASPIPLGMNLTFLLRGQIAFLSFVMLYQIIYWSFMWQPKQSQLTTKFTIRSVNAGTPRKMIR